MRFVTLKTEEGPRLCGVRPDGQYADLDAMDPTLPRTLKGLLALGPEALKRAHDALDWGTVVYRADQHTLLPPIPDPGKILCLGLNYRDHAIESGMEPPPEPVLFSKFRSALIGHGGEIVLPAVSREVDYEAELVAVIGRGGRYIPRERAMEHVAGYMVGNDVSARDWQLHKPGKQWLAGKTFDTFGPVGPTFVAASEVADPHALGIRLRLNGALMQESSTAEMIFKLDEVIAYASAIMTLEPGDLIFTGTPAGVGMARKPARYLAPGDEVEVEIDGLGTLRNHVVAEGR